MGEQQLFDLASLSKTLVTAPLALQHLDLYRDRREQLGLVGGEAITVAQLLSHTAGMPIWLPYNESLRESLVQAEAVCAENAPHPLLRRVVPNQVNYSDVSFRILADLLEMETGKSLPELARVMYGEDPVLLQHCPWSSTVSQRLPLQLPNAQDAEAWVLASNEPVPAACPELPHDCNARAGMRGHAGWAATARGFETALCKWVAGGWPKRQSLPVAANAEGVFYGFGLHAAQPKYLPLLSRIDAAGRLGGGGVIVIEEGGETRGATSDTAVGHQIENSEWWMHTGFTGGVVLVRFGKSEESQPLVIGILAHRLKDDGCLLNAEELTTKRLQLLEELI